MSEGLQLDSHCHDSLIDRNLGSTRLVAFVLGATLTCLLTHLLTYSFIHSLSTNPLIYSLTHSLGLILIFVALALIYIIYLSKANSEVRRVYYVLPIYNIIVLATRYYSFTHPRTHSLTYSRIPSVVTLIVGVDNVFGIYSTTGLSRAIKWTIYQSLSVSMTIMFLHQGTYSLTYSLTHSLLILTYSHRNRI